LERFAKFVLRFRFPLLALILVATALLLPHSVSLKYDNSLTAWFKQDDPEVVRYDRFIETFGRDSFIYVAIPVDDAFAPATMEKLSRLTEQIGKVENVDEVFSLANADYMSSGIEGLSVEPISEVLPTDPEARARFISEVLSNPLYVGQLVSKDAKTVAVAAFLKEIDVPNIRRSLASTNKAVAEQFPNQKVYIAGGPPLIDIMDRLSTRDLKTFTPITVLMVLFVLFLTFRNPTAVALPISAVAIAACWTLGIYSAAGFKMNMVSNILPPLIMVIGISDSVHIIRQYLEELKSLSDKRQALIATVKHIGVACAFTSVTTAIGFGSFVASGIPPIRVLGLFAALGVAFAILLSLTVIPIAYSMSPLPKVHKAKGNLLEDKLRKIGEFDKKKLVVTLVIAATLGGLSIWGITKIERETNDMNHLRKNNPYRIATAFIEERIGGSLPLELTVTAPGEEGIKEPRVLQAMVELEKYIGSIQGLSAPISIADYIKEINKALHDGDQNHYTIPETRSGVAQELLLYEMSGGSVLSHYVSGDFSMARISARGMMMSSEEAEVVGDMINEYIERNVPKDIKVEIDGIIPMLIRFDRILVDGQIRSFALALIVVSFVMLALLRSVRLALLSMIPNLAPIAITMGIMGWFGIKLDVATIMIGSVAIGIAVDDTIHFLVRFKREFAKDNDYRAAVSRTFATTGRAIVYTSVILTVGFFVLLMASFKPTMYFGLLCGITMVSALAGDLLVLPALILLFKPLGRGKTSSED